VFFLFFKIHFACFWQSKGIVLHRNQNNDAMDKSKSHYLVHGLFWKEQMHNAEDDRKIKEAVKTAVDGSKAHF
jgi:hypothetical protein